jgi:hypothetical protein
MGAPPLAWGAAATGGLNQPGTNPLSPVQAPQGLGATSGPAASQTGGALNPYGSGTLGGGALGSNLAQTNLLTGEQRNNLISPFAQQMFGFGNQAGNFYGQLTNLGSPYYQQQQAANFTQGVQQGNNAAALARQQQQAQGTGYTPSGANAAMIGGMGQAQAGNLNMSFLQNLFNNEQMQLQGAAGLGQLASLFNPTTLATGQVSPSINQAQNTSAQMLSSIGSLLGGGGSAGQTAYNIDQGQTT